MQTSDTDKLEFPNAQRRVMVVGLCLAGFGILYAAIAGGVARWRFSDTHQGAGLFFVVTAVFALSVSVAMLFMAAIAWFTARAADRAIGQFRRGECLADWAFPPAVWEDYLKAETRQRARVLILVITLAVMLPIAVPLAITAWASAATTASRLARLGLVTAVAALLVWLVIWLAARLRRRAEARMRRNPRVLIGRHAVYCGGGLTLWDVSMTVLQRARTVPGPPMMLEITIGPGRAARTMSTVADIAALAGGGGGASDMSTLLRLPVPADRTAEAERVVEALLQPASATAAASVVPAAQRAAPPAPASHTRRPHGWMIAAGLLVAGLMLFLTSPRPPEGSGQPYSGLGTAMNVLGLFLWIGSAVAAVAAGLGYVRRRLARVR